MNYRKYLRGFLISAMCVALIGCGQNTGTFEGKNETVSETINDTSVSKINTDQTTIDLNNGNVQITGTGVNVTSDCVNITASGEYVIKGTASDMMIKVDADKDAEVNLILDGVNISNENMASIFALKAKKVNITLKEGTTNELSSTGEIEAVDDTKVDGVIFSKCDLKFDGNGTLNINSAKNHAVVCKDDLKILSGNFILSAKKHGFQCKDNVVVEDGNILITTCKEGIEGQTITINGGTIDITSTDDGLNAAGSDSGDGFSADANAWIVINGGEIHIDAVGDGVDSNGDFTVNGGKLYVDGPVDRSNSPLDFGGTGIINGGEVVAVGSSGMAQNFGENSTIPSIYVSIGQMTTGEVSLSDADGNVIFTYSPKKEYNCVVISRSDLTVGNKYIVSLGGETVEVELTEMIYGNTAGFGGFGGFGGRGGDFDRGEGREKFGNFDENRKDFGNPGDFKPGVEQAPPDFKENPGDEEVARPTVGEMKDIPNNTKEQ